MALRAPCGLKSGSDLTLLLMSDAWRQGFGSQCSTSISMMTEAAGHHKSSDTDGWHSGGSSPPFSVSDFAIKKNKPNRASVSADCPGLPSGARCWRSPASRCSISGRAAGLQRSRKTQPRWRLGVIDVCACPFPRADAGRENVFVLLQGDALPTTVCRTASCGALGFFLFYFVFVFFFLVHIILFP